MPATSIFSSFSITMNTRELFLPLHHSFFSSNTFILNVPFAFTFTSFMFTFLRLRFYVYVFTFTFLRLRFYVYVFTFTFLRLRFYVYVFTFTFAFTFTFFFLREEEVLPILRPPLPLHLPRHPHSPQNPPRP